MFSVVNGLTEPLIASISRALAERDVEHRNLMVGVPCLNLNLSDGRDVFVKVSRPGDSTSRSVHEIASARWALDHDVNAVVPLVSEPIILFDANGHERAVTAWRHIQPAPQPGLEWRVGGIMSAICEIAAISPPPSAKLFNLDLYANRIHNRLREHHGAVPDLLCRTAVETTEPIRERLATRDLVWTHSDLHLNNATWLLNDKMIVLDWESTSIAPVEMDIARIIASIWVDTPGYIPWEKQRLTAKTYDWVNERLDVDWSLVADLMTFRIASHASHLIVSDRDPRLLADMVAFLRDTPTFAAAAR
jgi:hypothetical protein